MTDFLPEGSPSDTTMGGTPGVAPQPQAQVPPQPQQFAQPPTSPAYAPPSGPTWTAPQPAWTPAPPKKRKAWPWVVGIVGGLVVLGGVGAAIAFAVNSNLNADQNDSYTGSPITANDVPTVGDRVVVSDDGLVSFESDSGWVNASDYMDTAAIERSLPAGAHLIGAYFTSSLTAATDQVPSLVMVLEGSGPEQVGRIDVETAHRGVMDGAVKQLGGATDTIVSEPSEVTTANGLDGMMSTISASIQGSPLRAHEYTFARGKHVVFVQVMAYTDTFDDATAALVTDTLRIDK